MSGFLEVSEIGRTAPPGRRINRAFLPEVPDEWLSSCAGIFDNVPSEHHQELQNFINVTSRQAADRGATIGERAECVFGGVKDFARRKQIHLLRDEHFLAWPCVRDYCDFELSQVEDYLPSTPAVPPPTSTKSPRTANDDVSGIVSSCVADIEAKPIRWLWRGRIARGKVTLIAGHPGLGKSQAILNFAAIVTTGGKWPLGDEHCERGSVVILSAEDDVADTIRPRLEAAGANISRVHVFEAVRDEDDKGEARTRGLSLATDITRIAAKIADLGKVALLIVDPVSAYLGETDSHKNADVRALLAPLADMASRHGVAVVLITHLAKNASAEALLRVQGSIAFAAAARAAWGVARDKDNPSRRLFLPLKNNLGSDQSGLAFAVEGVTLPSGIETSRVVWEREPVTTSAEEAFAPDLDREERSAFDEAKEFLRGLLADGPVRAGQIRRDGDGAGFAWRTIQRAADALRLERVKGGMKEGWTWALPPKAPESDEGAK